MRVCLSGIDKLGHNVTFKVSKYLTLLQCTFHFLHSILSHLRMTDPEFFSRTNGALATDERGILTFNVDIQPAGLDAIAPSKCILRLFRPCQ